MSSNRSYSKKRKNLTRSTVKERISEIPDEDIETIEITKEKVTQNKSKSPRKTKTSQRKITDKKSSNNPSQDFLLEESKSPMKSNSKQNNKAGRPKKPLVPILAFIFDYNEAEKIYVCKFCPLDSNSIQKRTIPSHLHTDKHRLSVRRPEDIANLNKAIAYLEEIKEIKITEEAKLHYLEFLAFAIKSNLSFEQIRNLGQFLKQMAENEKISFLKHFHFDSEEVSKLSVEFGKCLINELKQDLEKSKYSLIADNVTASGTSIFGLKVRYLKHYDDQVSLRPDKPPITVKKSCYQNKVIAIKYLADSSEAATLMNVVEQRLFSLGEEVKSNLIGYVHDRGSNLCGVENGLGALLKQSLKQYMWDLNDPCHLLNSSLISSLPSLPNSILDFVDQIHVYFGSPQRVARLKQIQKNNNYDRLSVADYVKTRWLSLGESLTRLIQIWDSIHKYMQKEATVEKGEVKIRCEKFLLLLEDRTFKYKMIIFSNLIDIISDALCRKFCKNILQKILQKYSAEFFCKKLVEVFFAEL